MILRLAEARPQRDSIPCVTPSAGHAGAGGPPQAISHKNSLDICLSNIGGRRGHEHEQPRRVDCVEAGALMRATALALDAVKSLEDARQLSLGNSGARSGDGKPNVSSIAARVTVVEADL
jgi:hypothetical protein